MTVYLNFEFATAFTYVTFFSFEPTFRFVYEPEFISHYDDVVICYDKEGKDITGFGKAHGRYINIDLIEEDWFDEDDISAIPDLYDFYSNDDFYYDEEEEEDNNWFDESDVKDIPDFDSPNWGAIMAVAGKGKGICKDIFDWFDILSIPEVGAFNSEDIFDMSGMA
jgi:hypothetical protein